jgi:predicted MFS family arabinose efflux permease
MSVADHFHSGFSPMTEADASPVPVKGTSPFITGIGIAQICSWGSLYYAFPQMAAAMEGDLGWSNTQIYGAATLGMLLSALAAVPVGTAIDRGYGRWVMAGASVLAGLLLIGWSFVGDLVAYYVLVGGIGAMQAATLYEPAFAVVARRAGPLHARPGITAVTLWAGFASTIFFPLVELLMMQVGWRGTLQVLGAINIVICGGLYFTVIQPAKDQYRPVHAANGERNAALIAALKRPVFWALAAAFGFFAMFFSALTYHLYPLFQERGLDAASIVFAIALIGPAQVGGRFLISLFAPKLTARHLGSIIVLCFPACVLLLLFGPHWLAIACLATVIYGTGTGIMTIVRGISVPEMVSREGYGAISGAINTAMLLARAVGPLAAAWIMTETGGYTGTLIAMLVIAIAMVLCFWAAARLSRVPPH